MPYFAGMRVRVSETNDLKTVIAQEGMDLVQVTLESGGHATRRVAVVD